MASVHAEASPLSPHEAHLGFCESKERRQPGEQMSLIFCFHLFETPSLLIVVWRYCRCLTSSVLGLSIINFHCEDVGSDKNLVYQMN